MKEIKRDVYLNKLINRRENGFIKIITGIRRCGKSYLLDPLYKNYLLESGIVEDHIIKLDLDERKNKKFLNPDELDNYIRSLIKDENMYYVILDEVQKVEDFEAVLNGFLHIKNLDVYITGSNSKFLSSDIITEFRGRGDDVKVLPLTFSEFVQGYDGSIDDAWNEYITYGGMPRILSFKTEADKSDYLKRLFEHTYLKDIIERNNVQRIDVLDALVNILASSIGSLTNPNKLVNTFESYGIKDVSVNTLTTYINYLLDAFLITKAERYDVKRKKHILTPYKYYFADIGLRNSRLNFRQQEETHIMENVIYNELRMRGYLVDVGLVECWTTDENGKRKRSKLEVDFVVNNGAERVYVQSAFNMPTKEKEKQERRSLINIADNFRKVIVVKDDIKRKIDDDGVVTIGLFDFLLDEQSIEKY